MTHPRPELEAELRTLSETSRVRRSVDGFTRAALEGFAWAILAGVNGKLLYDSKRPPYWLIPLGLADLALLWDGVRSYVRARSQLRAELQREARVRELRVELGIDPASAA